MIEHFGGRIKFKYDLNYHFHIINPEKVSETVPQTSLTTNVVIFDMVRHGRTPYHEYENDPQFNESLGDERLFDLSRKGVVDVLKTARVLVRAVSQNERIVLWSSESWRARDSREIIKKKLIRAGIEIFKESIIRSLRPFDVFNQNFVKSEIIEVPKGASFVRSNRLFRDPDFQTPNKNFEVSSLVRRRAERVYNWVRYLAKTGDLQGKPLHIIATTHYEIMYPIMEDVFGFTLEKGQEPKKGEGMRIRFEYDKLTEQMTITAECRGIKKEGIVFDEKTRKFKVPRELEPAPLWSARIDGTPSTLNEFKQSIIHTVRETGVNCFGYFVGSEGNWTYIRNMYPRRKYGDIQSSDELMSTSEKIGYGIEASVEVEERISKPKFRVLLGLEIGYNTGKFHSIEEVKEILGDNFELTSAEIFTVRKGNDGPSTYQEPAVLIEGDVKEIERIIGLATKFNQQRFCLENLEDGTARIIETALCTSPDKF